MDSPRPADAGAATRLGTPLWTVLRTVLRTVLNATSPTGRAVALLGVAAWVTSALTELVELRILALMSGLVLLVAIPWLLVPMRVRAGLSVRPGRSIAGEQVEIGVSATNLGRLPLWRPLVRLPVGEHDLWQRLPDLAPGVRQSVTASTGELARGVLEVGPVAAVRADPLGLVRRWVRWCDPVELYVRPRMVALSSLGTGVLRDLEGAPTDRVSMSDLAFHALREYVPGDDLRHVHWRSSARAGELLVRQYHDSRRNHACIVLDPTPGAYADHDAYELAVSVAASLAMAAAREEYDVSLVSGPERVTGLAAADVLDATCRVQRDGDAEPLPVQVTEALALAPDTSLLYVVTGGGPSGVSRGVSGGVSGGASGAVPGGTDELDVLGAALLPLPADAAGLVVRCAPGVQAAAASALGHPVLTVGALADLPRLVAGA